MFQGFSGEIIAWMPERNYGFIKPTQSGRDVFFRRVNFEDDPSKIVVGARVRFDVVRYTTKRGPREQAAHVRLLADPAQPELTLSEILATPDPKREYAPKPQRPNMSVLSKETKKQQNFRF
jgi:cold shock CspA family protein